MFQYSPASRSSLAIGALLFAAACVSGDKKNSDSAALASDSALNRDIALAGTDTSAQPQLTDVPATTGTTPATSTPRASGTSTKTVAKTPTRTSSGGTAPKTSSGTSTGTKAGPTTGTLASGTTINIYSNDRVCTNTYKVGQTFTANVREPVSASNGVMIPAGAVATVRVTNVKRSNNVNENPVIGLAVTSIAYGGHTYAVSNDVTYAQTDVVKNQPKGKDVQKVATGAAIGAIAGQVLGKNTKSTVIGAAAGAAVGTGVAVATANAEGCIPSGGRIQIKLTAPVDIRM